MSIKENVIIDPYGNGKIRFTHWGDEVIVIPKYRDQATGGEAMRPIRDDSGERNGWWIGERFVPEDGSDLKSREAEIAKLRGMVLDLYLWLNAALATQFDRDFGDPTLSDIANGIDSSRWREIKSVVGQAADEEKR